MYRLLPSIVAALILASGASATEHQYGWTISASSTDPLVNSGPFVSGAVRYYLWYYCSTVEGMTAAEFDLETSSPDNRIISLSVRNGFLNAGTPTSVLLAVGGCPTGPVIAAEIGVLVSEPGEICFAPYYSSGINGTRDCRATPAVHPNDWVGFSTLGSPPCSSPEPLCEPPLPPNDTCDTAIDIPRCSGFSTSGTLVGMRHDYTPSDLPLGDGCTGRNALGPDVVYRVELLTGDVMTATYTVLGSDASLYLIEDCEDPRGSCVVGSDHDEWGGTETISWTAPSQQTYYLICDTWDPAPGDFLLDVTFDCATSIQPASWGGVKGTYR